MTITNADPMPPSASDTYFILKPREQWPDPDLPKDHLIRQFDTEASKLPGNKFGFSQPIEMRFNELIAGVREDLAVKVFGDEFAPMVRAAKPNRRRPQRGRRCGQREGRRGLGAALS